VTSQAESLGLTDALVEVRDGLTALPLVLELPGVQEARRVAREVADQVDDYLLPRLRQMDAPLLMVVGGSTGAGKSTLVNSLVGSEVSRAGVLRPTTRAPVLVFNPADRGWFADDRILPDLPRTTDGAADVRALQLAPTERLPAGLALLDAPDIDSVVAANRTLARQLLAAADAWLFVTTAARYADAVPWDLLQAARERGTALSLVLDRVPPDAAQEIAAHLREMLADRGLGETELLVVPESELRDGLLAPAALAPVRAWLDDLAADAQARSGLVRRTLAGALESLPRRVALVEDAAEEQRAAAGELEEAMAGAYADAREEVDAAVRNGALLRGEVLARWHDVVGTGDLMRAMETRVGWLRDRVRSLVTGGPRADAELRTAVEAGVDAVVHTAADHAAERTVRAWDRHPAGRVLLRGGGEERLDAASPRLVERTGEEVRAWQRFVFELVREEGAGRRTTARLASLGVNGAGLTVMIAVFASTGGLTGTEVVIAGGTSALSQKVLEALFGDQAVRRLAARAREDLLERVDRLLAAEEDRFQGLLAPVAPLEPALARVRAALAEVEPARP
jgi:energy-coupling factor transporter ATP-binding protein EcfA2